MAEQNVDLQPAIDTLTGMLAARVRDYIELKRKLPSFGAETNEQLALYYENLEHFVQGAVVWYYSSPRKCRGSGVYGQVGMLANASSRLLPTQRHRRAARHGSRG